MKLKFFSFAILLAIILVSCDIDERFDSLEQEMQNLQDTIETNNKAYNDYLLSIIEMQNKILNNSVYDIKAAKIEQIGNLFEACARQPELMDDLTTIQNTSSYSNISELMPLNDKNIMARADARGIALGKLIESCARQPEMTRKLDSIATLYLGTPETIEYSEELNNFVFTNLLGMYYFSVGRQPEMKYELDDLQYKYTQKYINQ